ncbi:PadR family transcriptional regulator [Methyloceanibacter caenitepidi]|uniref:Transcription regulator PadR N-terminal domain-containing protein n=1 Tax=Methyloceanibacter caenitepidi TaxID=1384459 RepID=A0A0A8K358_9HYPH|nr:PadR family transcriptional regulator [Methyloceanibacter caenitepidi]BAQ16967.1 hypothetical protein GL4_1511 [Methyloceanibacter caenitepidi]
MKRRERQILAVLTYSATPLSGAQIWAATGLRSASIYPTLNELEKAGDVESWWAPGPYPRTRIYRPTMSGRERFLDAFPGAGGQPE